MTVTTVRRFLTSSGLSLAFRYMLGAVILLSAVPKLIDIESNSIYVVYSYYLLPVHPVNFARFAGIVIPYVELLVGLGLILGVLTRLSAVAWIVMSMLYLAVKLHVIFVQGRIVDCGCFAGLIPHLKVTQSLWLDILGVVFCLQITLSEGGRRLLSLWAVLPERWRRTPLRSIW